MEISLSFVEYDAANGLRDLSPVAFTLLSTARLGQVGNRRTWIVSGNAEAFSTLRSELRGAKDRFLRSSIASAVANIGQYIDEAFELSLHKPKDVPAPEVPPTLVAAKMAPASC